MIYNILLRLPKIILETSDKFKNLLKSLKRFLKPLLTFERFYTFKSFKNDSRRLSSLGKFLEHFQYTFEIAGISKMILEASGK